MKLRKQEDLFYVIYVRGDTGYGVTDLADNGDDTVTHTASGLMWTQADSGACGTKGRQKRVEPQIWNRGCRNAEASGPAFPARA
ncbi:hypothetical protein [Pseudorhodobacter aquimaris]|uniref:hypothetical protein n=1 Tax=Pseudorhodobacter aquimaris TaxID=687412 RepID=UPI0012EDAC68|nr:hypothetical protein [Pseudorhodobacter aquimaris]